MTGALWRGGSLSGRIIRTTVVVVAAVLITILVALDILYGSLANKQVEERLADRAQFAAQMDQRDVKAKPLLRRIRGGGVEAYLVTEDGKRLYPSEFTSPDDPITVTTTLPKSGATLTLSASADLTTESRTTLRLAMIIVGIAALGATALILMYTVRRGTRPMDTMAELARAIAKGERGRRLKPERTDTELGRTAAAFDTMLDSLETAERRTRDSEARYRQFLADVAHELRTPLAGVQATAEAALHAPEDQSREEFDRIHLLLAREARRSGRLVEDLLLLARVDAGLELHIEPVDVHALCAGEAERMQLRAPELGVIVTGDEATVPGDAHRLGQVVANLLDNARRYGKPDQGTAAVVTVTVIRHPEWVTVDVADNGQGVAPSRRETIFHRFVRERADREVSGAGLGLAIARGIARAHGGDLGYLPSPPGATGAVFRLTLPQFKPRPR